jgi:hypothetical protein
MRRNRFGTALFIALLLTPLLTVTPVSARASDLYPDLEMAPLSQLALATVDGHPAVRFMTIVYNVGDGPMQMRAKRRVGNELRKVFQIITNQDGTTRRIRKYNANVFYSGDGHDHFHIARFNTVRLTPAPGNTYTMTERRLRKIGFCLVDSIKKSPAIPNQSPGLSFYWCGSRNSTFVKTGISVGWGDIYSPTTTFQDIDVSGLPQGNYRLCATVNPFGLWTEKANNQANNSKWTDIALDLAAPAPADRLQVIGEGEGC